MLILFVKILVVSLNFCDQIWYLIVFQFAVPINALLGLIVAIQILR